MSKRLSSGQSNTILNYFQSPKASPKPKAPVEETNGKSPKIPKIADDDSDEEVISKTKKRKKIIDSESEDEGESVTKKTKGLEETPSRNIQGASSNGGTPKRSLKRFTLGDQSLNESRDNATCDEKDEVAPTENIKTSQISAPIIVDKHSNWLHNNLEFLKPERIRDINRNRPDHPDYDSRTLHVPKDFLDKQTPAMRQWWILKSAHMDSVLFFKVGKFYELYHMDAVVGVTQLGFSYMKGEFAHSGFPESAYHKMANALIEKGYKVARTEQTETPEMMSDRCKKQGKTTKFDKVVNREICQISTKATCVYNAQLPDAMHSLSCYLYAICEKDMTARTMRFGVCFIDTSIGTFNLTEFDDDKHCSKLLALLAEHPPGLILTERRRMSPKLKEVMSTFYKDTRKDTLASDSQFYSATKTVETLINRDYYRDENNQLKLPPFIKEITDGYDAKPGHDLELRSLGACLWYLEDSKLDIQVISMGKFEAYQPLNTAKRTEIAKKYMVLDSITMTNLNLLGSQCSLQQTIDSCCTAFGKRLLQQWICRPLCDVDKIKERQEASKELYEHPGLLKEAHDILRKLPDLERQVAKIHMYGNRFFAQDHPDSRAVFYESATYSKRRLNDLLKTLQAFERAQEIESVFSGCESSLLRTLTQFPPIGRYVDLKEPLGFFRDAFDQKQAQEEGKITPKRGVDDKFDQAEEAIEEIQRELDDYLKEQHQFFRL